MQGEVRAGEQFSNRSGTLKTQETNFSLPERKKAAIWVGGKKKKKEKKKRAGEGAEAVLCVVAPWHPCRDADCRSDQREHSTDVGAGLEPGPGLGQCHWGPRAVLPSCRRSDTGERTARPRAATAGRLRGCGAEGVRGSGPAQPGPRPSPARPGRAAALPQLAPGGRGIRALRAAGRGWAQLCSAQFNSAQLSSAQPQLPGAGHGPTARRAPAPPWWPRIIRSTCPPREPISPWRRRRWPARLKRPRYC